jgi:F0F1-type ATP synthase alpha subunit
MQKVYDQISEISSSTFAVEADDVGLNEIARIDKKDGTSMLAMSIRIEGKKVAMQALESTSGLSTTDRVVFLKHRMRTHVGKELLGRRFDGQGRPIDGGPAIEGLEVDLSHQSVNPVQRTIPSEMVRTNIPMIDVFNTLVRSQKVPIFSVTGERYNELLMRIANQTDAEVVIIGGMGLRYDDYLKFIENAEGQISTTDGYEKKLHQLMKAHEQTHPLNHIEKFQVIKGDVCDTVPTYIDQHPETLISLAFFDLDLYKPTKQALQSILPRCTKGSILIFDELNYQYCPGETLAVLESLNLKQYSVQRFEHCSRVSFIQL